MSVLEDKLSGLSADSKDWLQTTCERFADGQTYDKNEKALKECAAAELVFLSTRGSMCIGPHVVDLVYSSNFFGGGR